jgi:hypothetical protein
MAITAKQADFPERVWFGKIKGQWPLYSFNSEGKAQNWASEALNGQDRYVLDIELDLSVEVKQAVYRPAKAEWID